MPPAVLLQAAYLGDAVLATPLIRALAAAHDEIDVVTSRAAAPLMAALPGVRDVIPFDRSTMGGLGGVASMAARLRRRRYGAAYLATPSFRKALIAFRARIPRRVGFRRSPSRWLYTESRPDGAGHEVDRLLGLADATGCSPPKADLEIVLNPNDYDIADAALDAAGIRPPFVVLAPGSARATKRWPYFANLAARLIEDSHLVVIGTAEERGLLRGLAGARRGADLAGKLPIAAACAVLERAVLAVTNDSAPLHLSQSVGTPVVAIFGPTHPAQGFGPRGSADIVVSMNELNCRPCSTHGGPTCPLGHHRCLSHLTTDDVYRAVRESLRRLEAEVSACG